MICRWVLFLKQHKDLRSAVATPRIGDAILKKKAFGRWRGSRIFWSAPTVKHFLLLDIYNSVKYNKPVIVIFLVFYIIKSVKVVCGTDKLVFTSELHFSF